MVAVVITQEYKDDYDDENTDEYKAFVVEFTTEVIHPLSKRLNAKVAFRFQNIRSVKYVVALLTSFLYQCYISICIITQMKSD